MTAAEDPRPFCATEVDAIENPVADQSDRAASERDRQADERDVQARERDVQAEERDIAADAADGRLPDGVIELRERRAVTRLRLERSTERHQAASDRSIAAADRRQAGRDRKVAAQERNDAREERELLQRDELTGVLHRGAGLVALEREVARSARTGAGFTVAFIDVDGLKRTNDEEGHAAGDAMLRTLGDTLIRRMRSYDLTLRYGGDEFVCILPGFDIAEADVRFRELQSELRSAPAPVHVSFGLAEWQRGEATDSLLARADAALYDERRATRDPHDSGEPPATGDESAMVAAHRLLNSSAVVCAGLATLQATWDRMSEPDRTRLVGRMLVHASSIDDRLKEMTRGSRSLGVTSRPA